MYGKFVVLYIVLIAFNAEINELIEYVILSRTYGTVPILSCNVCNVAQSYLKVGLFNKLIDCDVEYF